MKKRKVGKMLVQNLDGIFLGGELFPIVTTDRRTTECEDDGARILTKFAIRCNIVFCAYNKLYILNILNRLNVKIGILIELAKKTFLECL